MNMKNIDVIIKYKNKYENFVWETLKGAGYHPNVELSSLGMCVSFPNHLSMVALKQVEELIGLKCTDISPGNNMVIATFNPEKDESCTCENSEQETEASPKVIYESYDHLKHLTPIALNKYFKSRASSDCDYELDCFEVNVYGVFIGYCETDKILDYFKDCPLLVSIIMRDGLVKVCMKFDIEKWTKEEWLG